MKRVVLAALCTACVALASPVLAGAAVHVPADMTVGNDLGARSAVVNFDLPTQSDEGALALAECVPAPGSAFPVGTTNVVCTGAYAGQVCTDFGFPIGTICFPTMLAAGPGNFDVTVRIVRCTLLGDSTANSLVGTALKDWICGLGGADVLSGAGGPDILQAGGGSDIVIGGGGKDAVSGQGGSDALRVRDGLRDTVNCGPGSDLVVADSRDVVSSNCERVRRG